jgi:hypothetical protein
VRRVIKAPPKFKYFEGIEDAIDSYDRKYPKGKPVLEEYIFEQEGIDLSKLTLSEQIAGFRGQLLKTRVWKIETSEDLNKMFNHIKDFDTLAFDTETSNIHLKTQPRILLWSISVKVTESFVIPYQFNKEMLDFITSTEQAVVAHNMNFDAKLVHHYTNGKLPKNMHDTMLILFSLKNDSVLTPSLGLKQNSVDLFGSWSEKEGSYDISDLTEEDVDNTDLLYYAGVDSSSTLSLFFEHKEQIENTEDVDLFDILPSTHPKERSYSRYWFYKNVLRQLLPLTINMMNNGLPLNMDRVHELDGHLDEILGKADAEVLNLPTVMEYWEKSRLEKAEREKKKYKDSIDLDNIKIYKSTNSDYINLFITILYPDKTLPIKAKNWTFTVIKTFDSILAEAIKNKNLERLRFVEPYSKVFIEVEQTLRTVAKQNKIRKSEETAVNKKERAILDFEFKPLTSAAQKKYILQKGFGIVSNTKSMATGEDSFNREELTRLSKEVREGTELHKYLELLLVYSGGGIIKRNFVKNFIEFEYNGKVNSNLRLGSTKT